MNRKVTVWFSKADYQILESKSKRTSKTINDLIINAVRTTYGKYKKSKTNNKGLLKALDKASVGFKYSKTDNPLRKKH